MSTKTDLWSALAGAFGDLRDADTHEQGEAIGRIRAEDNELADRLEAMLRQHRRGASILETLPALDLDGTSDDDTRGGTLVGKQLGDITITELIDVGGMGVVYKGRQRRPKRTVAVKVMRASSASPTGAARFRHEADLLARLQHPNIAQVYAFGLHDEPGGTVPYLVLEYVEGKDLLQHAAEQSTRDRLGLFLTICRAVQYAHLRGVIHRDLKPANILVTPDGVPKILDFGVARAAGLDGSDTTRDTAVGQIIGTLAYMSPEQASGDPDAVDLRSDVYALGVVLYELLTGKLPHDLTGSAPHQAAQKLLEAEPARLSTHDRSLRGDVETVVQTALERDVSRRYQSAGELADDVQRFLEHHPIHARPVSIGRRMRKFARRNRRHMVWGAAGIAGTLTLVMAVLVLTVVRPRMARAELMRAQERLLDSQHATKLFNLYMFRDPSADAPPMGDPAVLEPALAFYAAATRLDPFNRELRLERDIVRLALDLASPSEKAPVITAAVAFGAPLAQWYAERWSEQGQHPALTDEQLEGASPIELRAVGLLAMLSLDMNSAVNAWSRLEKRNGVDPLVEASLGIAYLVRNEPALALVRLRRASEAYPDAADVHLYLADASVKCGDLDRAERALSDAIDLGIDDPLGGATRVSAALLAARGKYEQAIAEYELCIVRNSVARLELAQLYADLGDFDRALSTLEPIIMQASTTWFTEQYLALADAWWMSLNNSERMDARSGSGLRHELFTRTTDRCHAARSWLNELGIATPDGPFGRIVD